MEIFEINSIIPAKELTGFNFNFEIEKTTGKKRLTFTDNNSKSVSSTALNDLRLLRDDALDLFRLRAQTTFNLAENQIQAFLKDITTIVINLPKAPDKSSEKDLIDNLKRLIDDPFFSSNPTDPKLEKSLISQLSKIILGGYHIKTIEQTKEILRYKNGVYLSGEENHIVGKIEENIELKSLVTNHLITEVIGHVQRSTFTKLQEFDNDPFIINVKNALVNIRTREVKEHTPDYLSRIQLPVEYNPEARCKEIPKFLREVMPDPTERTLLIEEAAYTLVRNARQQKAFMYVGEGANGKTTWLAVITALLGTANIANIPLQKLAGNRFAAAGLEAKLANIYSDISDLEMKETGIIKSIISGDPIDVERKGKQSYTLSPYAKLFYCANKLPEVNNDQSFAFYRRWIIHNFEQRFEGAARDKHIIDKLTTPEELSGFLNLLIPIACKLANGSDFSNAPTTEEIREMWGEKANIIKAFKAAILQDDPNGYVPTVDVYQAYIDWCKTKNYTAKSRQSFLEQLAKEGLQRSVKKPRGKSIRVLLGCRFKVTEVTEVTPVHSQNLDSIEKGDIEGVTCVTSVTGEVQQAIVKHHNHKRFKNPIPKANRDLHDAGLAASNLFFAGLSEAV